MINPGEVFWFRDSNYVPAKLTVNYQDCLVVDAVTNRGSFVRVPIERLYDTLAELEGGECPRMAKLLKRLSVVFPVSWGVAA